jgi:hypothetical protein
MKQGELWRNEVVKDPVVIKAWLEKCLAVLAGEHPHTGAWFWKQTNWNEYTLIGGRNEHKFGNYALLCAFCKERGINATQA